jgi:FixJ family two-component response regulator
MMTQTAPPIAKQVVILVDDDEGVRNSLRNMMEGEGFVVHAFSNGRDFAQRYEPAGDWVSCR